MPALLTRPSSPPSDLGVDPRGGRGDLPGVGDVEDQRRQALGAGLAQRLGVLLPAHAGEDLPAGGVEAQGGGTADPGGGAGDQDRAHRAGYRAGPTRTGGVRSQAEARRA